MFAVLTIAFLITLFMWQGNCYDKRDCVGKRHDSQAHLQSKNLPERKFCFEDHVHGNQGDLK